MAFQSSCQIKWHSFTVICCVTCGNSVWILKLQCSIKERLVSGSHVGWYSLSWGLAVSLFSTHRWQFSWIRLCVIFIGCESPRFNFYYSYRKENCDKGKGFSVFEQNYSTVAFQSVSHLKWHTLTVICCVPFEMVYEFYSSNVVS